MCEATRHFSPHNFYCSTTIKQSELYYRKSGTMCFVSLRREDLDARFPGLLDAILGACAKEEQDSIGSAR